MRRDRPGGQRPRRGLDRGYRPYDGTRGGQAASTYALYKASIRRALGLRRSWRQKVAPFVLLGVVTIPAIVNVGIGYVTRNQVVDRVEIVTYRDTSVCHPPCCCSSPSSPPTSCARTGVNASSR